MLLREAPGERLKGENPLGSLFSLSFDGALHNHVPLETLNEMPGEPELQPQLCSFLLQWLWTSHLATLSLNFHIIKQRGWGNDLVGTFQHSMSLECGHTLYKADGWVMLQEQKSQLLNIYHNLDYYCFMQSQLQVWVTLQNNCLPHSISGWHRLCLLFISPLTYDLIGDMQVGRVTRERIIHRLFTDSAYMLHTSLPLSLQQRQWVLSLPDPWWYGRTDRRRGWAVEMSMFSEGEKYWRLMNIRNVYTQMPFNDKDLFFSFSSCFINSSDNILRSIEKLFITPFYQWENVPRNIEQHMQCHRPAECLEWV